MKTHEFLEMYAKILATYSNAVSRTCQKYGINKTSFDILIFLKNNPKDNTARSIEEKRGIKKSIASVTIEKLCQLGYLNKYSDEVDRRIQHLELTEKSIEITTIGQQLQSAFQERLFSGLSQEEKDIYLKVSEKLLVSLNDMKGEELL